MSYFNQDQQDWMEYIFSVPREERCLCGWDRKGRCFNPACLSAHAAEVAALHPPAAPPEEQAK